MLSEAYQHVAMLQLDCIVAFVIFAVLNSATLTGKCEQAFRLPLLNLTAMAETRTTPKNKSNHSYTKTKTTLFCTIIISL